MSTVFFVDIKNHGVVSIRAMYEEDGPPSFWESGSIPGVYYAKAPDELGAYKEAVQWLEKRKPK